MGAILVILLNVVAFSNMVLPADIVHWGMTVTASYIDAVDGITEATHIVFQFCVPPVLHWF